MRLGAIADDLTGATDLAIMLTTAGFETVVIPEAGMSSASAEDAGAGAANAAAADVDAEAIVVALKTRTVEVDDAVARSLAALDWLQDQGCQRFYFKYCSTFDSTPAGNIGPVAEALLDRIGSSTTVIAPAFPANGRTVYQGHLFVHDQPLNESPLKDHPLTPMRDSSLTRLLAPQVAEDARIEVIPLPEVLAGADALRKRLREAEADGARYLVVDAVTDEHLVTLAEASAHLPLLTGGSGLAQGLQGPHASGEISVGPSRGRRVIVAGSASAATQAQVRHALGVGRGIQLDLEELRRDVPGYTDRVVGEILERAPETPVTVYATASPEDLGTLEDAPLIEQCLAGVALAMSAEPSVDGLVVAGGETSGAVIEALGITALRMGPTLDPGVAWALAERTDRSSQSSAAPDADDDDAAVQPASIPVVLKSGNFGGEDLLTRAWEMKA